MVVDGQSPRDFNGKETRKKESVAVLKEYSNVIREYCHVGDPVCAKDSESADVRRHLNYFDLHNRDAAAWVVSHVSGKAYKPKGDVETQDPTTTITASSSKTKQPEKTSAPEPQHSTPEAASTPTSQPNGSNGLSQKFPSTSLAVICVFFGMGMI
jgi:hypothetical protein